jgi:hypothetical protein
MVGGGCTHARNKNFSRAKRHGWQGLQEWQGLFFVLSNIMQEFKLVVTVLLFQLHTAKGYFGLNFVRVCCRSNENSHNLKEETLKSMNILILAHLAA